MMAAPKKINKFGLRNRIRRAPTPEKKLRLLTTFAYEESIDVGKHPCLFRTIGDEVEVTANRGGAFSQLAQAERNLIIGCGVAMFRFRIAMKYFGNTPIVRTFPDLLDTDLLALIRLGPEIKEDEETSRLFHAMESVSFMPSPDMREKDLEGIIPEDDLVSFRLAARAEGAHLAVIHLPEGGSLINGTESNESHGMTALVLTTTKDLMPDHLAAGQALSRMLLAGEGIGLTISLQNRSLCDAEWRRRLRDHVGGWPQAILVPGAMAGDRPLMGL